jgi:molybdopterin-guanine dinucleotide biosynthesis protein A
MRRRKRHRGEPETCRPSRDAVPAGAAPTGATLYDASGMRTHATEVWVGPDANAPPERVHAFILAGGESRRMGSAKARLSCGGEPLARRLAREFEPVVAQVWLVAKAHSGFEDLGLPLCYDRAPERALVHGIHAALDAPGPEWRLVLACDMPGVDRSVLGDLWRTAVAAGSPGSYPQCGEEVEPLPSLWHRDVAARIRSDWGVAGRDWLAAARLAAWLVPPERWRCFANVNTPDEWEEWQWRDAGRPPASR